MPMQSLNLKKTRNAKCWQGCEIAGKLMLYREKQFVLSSKSWTNADFMKKHFYSWVCIKHKSLYMHNKQQQKHWWEKVKAGLFVTAPNNSRLDKCYHF